MAGYIKLTRLARRTGTDNRDLAEYQVNYTVGGASYVIAYDDPKLREFLLRKVALDQHDFEAIIDQLRREGHATIGDVDISESEASSMGMEQVPDDF